MPDKDLFPSFNSSYHQPFEGQYVRLPCNQTLLHDSKVAALSISIDKESCKDKLTYICPVCKMQHTSLLEG